MVLPHKKAKLLKCGLNDLDRLFILNGRQDYGPLLKWAEEVKQSHHVQGQLLEELRV